MINILLTVYLKTSTTHWFLSLIEKGAFIKDFSLGVELLTFPTQVWFFITYTTPVCNNILGESIIPCYYFLKILRVRVRLCSDLMHRRSSLRWDWASLRRNCSGLRQECSGLRQRIDQFVDILKLWIKLQSFSLVENTFGDLSLNNQYCSRN